jgi:hypothetical protein
MKKIIFFFSPLLFICLGSCVISDSFFFGLNNEEIIRINPDGSGAYSLQLDLGDFLEQTGDMVADQLAGNKSLKIDTSIVFNNSLDLGSKTLTNAEKKMFEDGSAKIDLDLVKKNGIILVKLFYKDVAQLAFEREHILEFIKKNTGFALSLLMPTPRQESIGSNGSRINSIEYSVVNTAKGTIGEKETTTTAINPLGKAFSLQISNTFIGYKLTDSSLFQRTMASETSLKELKSHASAWSKIYYRTTFILPREIKNYKGPDANISADKKTITFKNSMADIFEKPQLSEYSIAY